MKHSWIISSHAGSVSLPSRGKFSAKTSTATFAISSNTRFYTVEYKTVLPVTGNAFIETIPVDMSEKAGWAFTSQADMLLYFDPATR